MKKFIYSYNKKVRVRVKPTHMFKKWGEVELQVQKNFLFIFWVNCLPWITFRLEEREYNPSWPTGGNPRKDYYMMGNIAECWESGSMDIKTRSIDLIKEYYKDKLELKKRKEIFKQL